MVPFAEHDKAISRPSHVVVAFERWRARCVARLRAHSPAAVFRLGARTRQRWSLIVRSNSTSAASSKACYGSGTSNKHAIRMTAESCVGNALTQSGYPLQRRRSQANGRWVVSGTDYTAPFHKRLRVKTKKNAQRGREQ